VPLRDALTPNHIEDDESEDDSVEDVPRRFALTGGAVSFAAMAGRSRFSMSPRSMIDVAALERVVSGVSRTDIQQGSQSRFVTIGLCVSPT